VAREWNTPVRDPWNGTIKASLDAVDRHNDHYFKTNNYKHLIAAHYLRQYVKYVKDIITELEETCEFNTH
jgi:hypothetical protein